jgi:hypothetical protein
MRDVKKSRRAGRFELCGKWILPGQAGITLSTGLSPEPIPPLPSALPKVPSSAGFDAERATPSPSMFSEVPFSVGFIAEGNTLALGSPWVASLHKLDV